MEANALLAYDSTSRVAMESRRDGELLLHNPKALFGQHSTVANKLHVCTDLGVSWADMRMRADSQRPNPASPV